MVYLTKKLIESHIDFLKTFLKTNNFGVISDISKNGTILLKNVTQNGTFFKIPLYEPFSKYHGDLHLSVFEDSGIVTKHVTFKTKINGKDISFYYGKKYKLINGKPDFEDYDAKLWTVPPEYPFPDDIKIALKYQSKSNSLNFTIIGDWLLNLLSFISNS